MKTTGSLASARRQRKLAGDLGEPASFRASLVAAPSGFTLLEVVFAVGLTLVLMVVLAGALDVYRQLATAGREQIEQAQLARSILRMIEVDIRSSAFQPADDPLQSLNLGDAAGGQLDANAAAVDPAAALSDAATGIIGDAGTLIIHARRPLRDLTALLDPAASVVAAPSDLQSITYFLADRGAAGLPGATAAVISSSGQDDVVGLARLAGDQLAMQFADATADVGTMASAASLVAAEVDSLAFRYFDGVAWVSAWDSTGFDRLPNAVEITLSLRPAADDDDVDKKESVIFRHVVALPHAEPAVLNATAMEF